MFRRTKRSSAICVVQRNRTAQKSFSAQAMATTDSEVLEVQHQLLADESGQACAGVPTEAPSTTIQQRGVFWPIRVGGISSLDTTAAGVASFCELQQ